MVKNLPAMKESQVPSLGQEDPLEDEWPPTPVFLPGKPHGQKSLAGTVHGVAKESNTSEQPSSRLQSVGFQKSWTSLNILARETFIHICTCVHRLNKNEFIPKNRMVTKNA